MGTTQSQGGGKKVRPEVIKLQHAIRNTNKVWFRVRCHQCAVAARGHTAFMVCFGFWLSHWLSHLVVPQHVRGLVLSISSVRCDMASQVSCCLPLPILSLCRVDTCACVCVCVCYLCVTLQPDACCRIRPSFTMQLRVVSSSTRHQRWAKSLHKKPSRLIRDWRRCSSPALPLYVRTPSLTPSAPRRACARPTPHSIPRAAVFFVWPRSRPQMSESWFWAAYFSTLSQRLDVAIAKARANKAAKAKQQRPPPGVAASSSSSSPSSAAAGAAPSRDAATAPSPSSGATPPKLLPSAGATVTASGTAQHHTAGGRGAGEAGARNNNNSAVPAGVGEAVAAAAAAVSGSGSAVPPNEGGGGEEGEGEGDADSGQVVTQSTDCFFYRVPPRARAGEARWVSTWVS